MRPVATGLAALTVRSAVVGYHDLIGNTQGPNFWNYSHKTPGCSQANLQRVGGGGLFYCFAVN
jgi:hypothetical protein